ncbi:hypothetical protein J3458_002045 [Metarhizium acridum]|uniref:uncharacterized protein n=1 Tax=Metarhizium acridum TaxID=92637 RepID=UPI001C6CF3DC|nr:hypothetical protein J3458_002045 [Metarhizium acridum]
MAASRARASILTYCLSGLKIVEQGRTKWTSLSRHLQHPSLFGQDQVAKVGRACDQSAFPFTAMRYPWGDGLNISTTTRLRNAYSVLNGQLEPHLSCFDVAAALLLWPLHQSFWANESHLK